MLLDFWTRCVGFMVCGYVVDVASGRPAVGRICSCCGNHVRQPASDVTAADTEKLS